jgi:hypothetical protein
MITISLGIKGLLLLIYIIIEITFIRYRKRSLILSLIPYIIMIRTVNKSLPHGWRVNDALYFFFHLNRKLNNISVTSVMVRVKSNLISDGHSGVTHYEFIDYNWYGKIVNKEEQDGLKSLIHYCNRKNSQFPDIIRDAKLKDLGI